MAARAVARGAKVAATAALVALALLPGCSAPRGEGEATATSARTPVRIVSMNPCVDGILREVADPAQIAAISHYSHDPRSTSVPLAWARRFPAVGDSAEDVLSARPDLVIAGPHIAPDTLAALKRMGVPLLSTTVPATVEESTAQIAQIAARIGRAEQGRALGARIDRAVEAARAEAGHGLKPRALIWQDGGLVPGPGTLANALLEDTGFLSAAARMRLAQWDMVSVEQLLLTPPDVVMTGAGGMESSGDSGNAPARHPVLAEARQHIMVAPFPSRLLHCAGPTIIETVGQLTSIRARWREHGA